MEEFEKRVKEQFEEEIKPNKKILNLLNEFGNLALRNNYHKLTVSDKRIFVIFELIKMKSSNIRDYLEEETPNSLECYYSMIFEMFFINENDFIYENLDEKIKCFEILINRMKNKINEEEENRILSEYKYKNQKFKILYDNIFINQFQNEYLGFLCIITLCHNQNAIKFLEFFIKIVQNILNIKIDFTLHDIRKLSLEKAVDDIIKIFNRDEKVNNIHLEFKENRIDYHPFSEDELKKKIEENETENFIMDDMDDINNINIINDEHEDLNNFIDDENEEINYKKI